MSKSTLAAILAGIVLVAAYFIIMNNAKTNPEVKPPASLPTPPLSLDSGLDSSPKSKDGQ